MDMGYKLFAITMILNFVFLITFGALSFFLYIYLLAKIISRGMNKALLEKYIRIFSFFSIFPSITLIGILILSVFNVYALVVFVSFIESGFPLVALVIAWIMPPIFLIIKPLISKRPYFYKFFITWYGLISLFLYCSIYTFILP